MYLNNEGHGSYPAAPAVAADSTGGLDLGHVFRLMRARWWLVLITTAAAFGLAWFLVPRNQSTYQSTVVARIADTRAEVSAGLAGGNPELRSVEYMTTQLTLLRSQALVGEIVDALGLRLWSSPDIGSNLLADVVLTDNAPSNDTIWVRFAADRYTARVRSGQSVSASYGSPVVLGGVQFTLTGRPMAVDEGYINLIPRQEAIGRVTLGLGGVRRGTSAILDIFYQDPDSSRARQVVNAVADAYQRYNTDGTQEQARARRVFLEGRLLEADGTLARAEQTLREFQAADRTYASRERLQAETSTLLALDATRRQLEDERRIYRSFLDRVGIASADEVDSELRTLMAAPGVAGSPLLSQLYTELTGYQLERERLLAGGLASTNPQVTQLDQLIQARRASIADAARTQVASLDLRIASVDDQRLRSSATLQALPDMGNEEARLIAEVDAARQDLATLNAQYQAALLEESLEVSQVQIIDYVTGVMPMVVGRRGQILLIAVVFGILLGGGGALLLEVTNSSVRGRTELEELLAVPALGVIPRIDSDFPKKRLLKATSSVGSEEHPDVLAAGSNGQRLAGPPDIGSGNPSIASGSAEFHSQAAEAYRMLRTNLVFLSPDREFRTLTITSALSGEGKTTTSVNLAAAFARQGKRVLLVDCDLRRPRLHLYFGVDRSPGFTELLLGDVAALRAVRPTPIERLYLLPRGAFDDRAPEMLSGSFGVTTIRRLRENWDLVIFDTSPVLLTAVAAAVAPNTDGVLLVVRAGQTSRDAARQAVQQLNVVGARVVGFVLNDPDAVGQRYGEYKYAKEYYAVEA